MKRNSIHQRFLFFFIVFILFGSGLGISLTKASPFENRFCVVPIKNGTPTITDDYRTSTMTSTKLDIEHHPTALFSVIRRDSIWEINKSREWVLFDHELLQEIERETRREPLREPWGDRSISIVRQGLISNSIIIFQQNLNNPIIINKTGLDRDRQFSGPFFLPSRKESLVISDGIPFVVGDTSLEKWPLYDVLAIPRIDHVYDEPALGGLVISSEGRGLFLYSQKGMEELGYIQDERIGDFKKLSGFQNAVAFKGSNNFYAKHSWSLLKRDNVTDRIVVSDITQDNDNKMYFYLDQFQQIVRYNPDLKEYKYKWQRLTPDGFENISGLKFLGPPAQERPLNRGFKSAPYMNMAIFEDENGFFIYDGEQITEAKAPEELLSDRYLRVVPMPETEKVLVVSAKTGLFQLARDGSVSEIDWDFDIDGAYDLKFINWPVAGVDLILSKEGLYVLDQNLELSPVVGGNYMGRPNVQSFVGSHPVLGDVILSTSKGLFAVVDKEIDGTAACDRREKIRKKIKDVKVCLLPVKGTDREVIGSYISSIKTAPDGKGIVLGTEKGVFQFDEDNSLVGQQSNPEMLSYSLRSVPWSSDLIVDDKAFLGRDMELKPFHDGPAYYPYIIPSMKSVLLKDNYGSKAHALYKFTELGAEKTKPGLLDFFSWPLERTNIIARIPWKKSLLVNKTTRHNTLSANLRTPFLMNESGEMTPIKLNGYNSRSFEVYRKGWLIERMKTVLVFSDGWFRITEDLSWEAVEGLPDDVRILTTYDPGKGGVFLGTTKGVYLLNPDYRVSRLKGQNPETEIKDFSGNERGGEILAGGFSGLFYIDPTTLSIEPVVEDIYEIVGDVSQIQNVSFVGKAFVTGSNGDFVIDRNFGISRFSNFKDVKHMTIFPKTQKIYGAINRSHLPLLHEIQLDCGS
ncbi:hypothetical protein WH95_01495 [Kiloniella litopenaei]|uniref:Uncharacterized protein n=1 Tax=Kiloniella litopenaei TaxID=1549748 RepID=A0A0M2REA6_9PROT|nr:hypothetical protein [Kiloniella litopenaei]KKJ78769.1 hypothetical protein WH95_01495 [Kiloniella litopenaei]